MKDFFKGFFKLIFYYCPIIVFVAIENNSIPNIINSIGMSSATNYSQLYSIVAKNLFVKSICIFQWFLVVLIAFFVLSIILSWYLNHCKGCQFTIDIGKLAVNQFKNAVQYVFTVITFLFAIISAIFVLKKFDKTGIKYLVSLVYLSPILFGIKFLQVSYLIRLPKRNSDRCYTWRKVFESLNLYIHVWKSLGNFISNHILN